jgi:hypothetical protein
MQTNLSLLSKLGSLQTILGGQESGTNESQQLPIAPIDIMRALPFGKFHTILIAIHVILYISSSFTIYNMGFLQMLPAYQCSQP